MTDAQLEAIYKANLGNGFITALSAVYTQGWYDGKGTSVPTSGVMSDRASAAASPTTIVTFPKKG